MASITSVGVGSGLDLESLIENIISAERTPTETRLNLQETETQASISAFGSIKSTLATFQSALSDLKDSDYFSSRKATSGNSESFTATANSTADVANYDIAVLSLASTSKVATNGGFADPSATVGEGTLTLSLAGGDSFDIAVAVAATDSLSDIRDAINNASDNPGITASLLTVDDPNTTDGSTITELVLTSTTSGADNQISISVDDTGDANDTDGNGLSVFYFDGSDPDAVSNQLVNKSTAQDAAITVDGFTAYSSTNAFDNVIDGVTITAIAEDENPSDPTTAVLNIAIDTAGVQKAITNFAASYNELILVMNQLTDYDADTETRGILGSDSSARIIEAQIRRIMSSTVDDAASGFNNLAYLGIATNQNGTVSLDDDELSEAISSNFDELVNLFASDTGIATELDSLLDSFLQAGGTIANKESILQEELSVIEEKRFDLEFRLEKIEERYRSQFAALDILVAQLNQTGNFLSEQLAATANIISGKKD